MKRTFCAHEGALVQAARNAVDGSEIPQSLVTHAAECAVCGEVLESARWMQNLARAGEISQTNAPLPDAGLIWRRAQWAASDEKRIRRDAIAEWLQTAMLAAVPGGLAAWIAFRWQAIEAATSAFLLHSWPQFSAYGYMLASLAPAALLIGALALGYPLLIED